METRSNKKMLLKWLAGIALAASIAGCMLPALLRYLDQSGSRFGDFRGTWLAVALLLSLIVRPLTALVWQIMLAALGHRLPVGTASRIWLVAESCRWLPGGVWHFGSRAVQSSAHGVPYPVAIASMGLELVLTIVACLIFAMTGMIAYGSQAIGAESLISARALSYIAIGGFSLIALGGATYWSLRRFSPEKYRALCERLTSLRHIHPRGLPTAVCLSLYVLLAGLNGAAFYATVLAVTPNTHLPLFAAVAANSLAWVAGLMAVISLTPAGLGIREGVLVLQLSVWMLVADALLVAVLWRLLLLVVELLWVAVAGAWPLLARAYVLSTTARNTDESNTCLDEIGD